MVSSDDLSLAYHERCKRLCNALGVILFGASLDSGLSYHLPGGILHDMDHRMFLHLEALLLGGKIDRLC